MPKGAGFDLRALVEFGGSGLDARFIFVLGAELGVRDILGVSGNGAEEAVCREIWEMEDRRSWSLVVGVDGGRGGSATAAAVSDGEPL